MQLDRRGHARGGAQEAGQHQAEGGQSCFFFFPRVCIFASSLIYPPSASSFPLQVGVSTDVLLEEVIRGVSGVESHLCNVISCRRTYFDLNVKNAFRKPETLCMPHTINAYYNPTANEMVIPMGFLQAPLLDVTTAQQLDS